jgi:hypothetical protein
MLFSRFADAAYAARPSTSGDAEWEGGTGFVLVEDAV